MWEKLFSLLNDKFSDTVEDEPGASVLKQQNRQAQLSSQSMPELPSPASKGGNKSTLIGYNYLKGMEDYEDSSKRIRRFRHLNELLRGKYHGKIESDFAESESNSSGEDDD